MPEHSDDSPADIVIFLNVLKWKTKHILYTHTHLCINRAIPHNNLTGWIEYTVVALKGLKGEVLG